MKNIKNDGNFNSRLIALQEAYKSGDTETVEFLIV